MYHLITEMHLAAEGVDAIYFVLTAMHLGVS